MKRTNLARARVPFAFLLAALSPLGCAAPDAVPGARPEPTGPTTGAGGPSTVVGTDLSWVRTFGDVTGALQRGRDVVFDAKSNTLVVTVDFDPMLEVVGLPASPVTSLGTRDVFILKYPVDGGVPLWGVRGGGFGEQFRATAAVDIAGNVIVAGGFDGAIDFGSTPVNVNGLGDVFVAKLDPNGNQVWLKTFGDGDLQFATDVAVDDEGNILVVGLVKGQIDFGLGPLPVVTDRDMFIAKLDPGGNPVWAYRPGRAADEDFRSPTIAVASAGAGKIAVTGASEGLIAFPPVALQAKGDGDAFFVLLDGEGKGDVASAALYGAPLTRQRGFDVAALPTGEIAITGEMAGTVNIGGVDLESRGGTDAFLAVYDAAGKPRWTRRFGGPASQSGRSVAIDADGNLLVTGLYSGVIEFFGENAFVNGELADSAWDGFVTKLDPTGEIVWAVNMSGPQQQVPSSIAALSDGSAVVTGWYETQLDPSGAQSIPSTGGADGFILSLAP